jgi:ATP-dependent Clp protease adaptor protein ClpS
MSAPGNLDRPEIEEQDTSLGQYIVTVYDNDYNTVEEVIVILMAATGCCMEEAEMETWEVHHLGQSVVHHGAEQECRQVAEIIGKIGIRVEVRQE